MELKEMVDYLVEMGICTSEEYILVSNINGESEDTINDILYERTGYNSLEQYMESEQEEDYNYWFGEDEDDEEDDEDDEDEDF